MTDPVETSPPPELPPSVVSPAVPSPVEPTPPPSRPRWPWLVGLGFLVLAGAQAAQWYLVLHPQPHFNPPDPRWQTIEDRLSRLEARPVAAAPDLGPLTARITALEQKPADTDVLARRINADEARLSALEKGPPAPSGPQTPSAAGVPTDQIEALTRRLDAAEARLATLEKTPSPPPITAPVAAQAAAPNVSPAQIDALSQRLAADDFRLAALEKAANTPSPAVARAARIARVQAAFVALSLGQALGDIPDAPPALARYANVAPPTEATLRLDFAPAAQAALAAGHKADSGKHVFDRLWAQAQDLMTIRQGDHVLLGDPDAGVLAHAQTLLEAGDLAGAVATVGTLTGPPAQAMASWLDAARGLLAARASLAELAARA